MEFRNAKYNAAGTIDCEIDHPRYGWIPITIDETEYPDLYPLVLASEPAAYVAPAEPTAAEVLADKRTRATIDLADLLLKLVQASAITVQEAKAWVRDNTLPAAITDAIDGLTGQLNQISAEIEARRDARIQRNGLFIQALQAAYSRTDAQIDALFDIE